MRVTRASLVSFVGGDDVVSSHYLTIGHAPCGGYKRARKRSSDLHFYSLQLFSNFYEVYGGVLGRMIVDTAHSLLGNEIESMEWSAEIGECRVFLRDDAIWVYLRWEIDFVARGRIASRYLYLRKPFKSEVLHEDSYSFHSRLSAVRKVVLLDATVYGHVTRESPISHPQEITSAHIEGKFEQ